MGKVDKNEREKNSLYEYAVQNTRDYQFTTIDREKDSYYLKRNENFGKKTYLKSYGFEKLPELMEELDVLWGTEKLPEELRKIVGIAAMKNKISDKQSVICDEVIKTKQENKLPAYIYNF